MLDCKVGLLAERDTAQSESKGIELDVDEADEDGGERNMGEKEGKERERERERERSVSLFRNQKHRQVAASKVRLQAQLLKKAFD